MNPEVEFLFTLEPIRLQWRKTHLRKYLRNGQSYELQDSAMILFISIRRQNITVQTVAYTSCQKDNIDAKWRG